MQSAVDQLLGHALQIKLRCDNSAAIILALRKSFQPLKWKTRGVALRASWLRDSIHILAQRSSTGGRLRCRSSHEDSPQDPVTDPSRESPRLHKQT